MEESTKCMNPKHECSPKRQNRLGEEKEVAAMLENPKKVWSHKICHSYLQKCLSTTQNYKTVILPLRITKMSLWAENVENVGPMTWRG